MAGRIRRIPQAPLDRLTVCRPVALDLCAGDNLQLKANASDAHGEKLANGEIVTVAAITDAGAIELEDGRTLPPTYRQFLRGYAVTSYGSQGKTVDHVLFADAAVRCAENCLFHARNSPAPPKLAMQAPSPPIPARLLGREAAAPRHHPRPSLETRSKRAVINGKMTVEDATQA